jgi:hypothetical protein
MRLLSERRLHNEILTQIPSPLHVYRVWETFAVHSPQRMRYEFRAIYLFVSDWYEPSGLGMSK